LSASQASLADDYAWQVAKPRGGVSLLYGSKTDIDDTTLLLVCSTSKKTSELSLYQELKTVEAGQPLKIEVGTSAAKIALDGAAVEDDYFGMVIPQAKDFAVKPLLKVLEAPGVLTVKAGDVESTMPDEGRAAAVAEFGTLCTLD
jgi:hypothetical protein